MPQLPERSTNMSHSYLVQPDVNFSSQQQDEKVVLVVRKHIFTQFSWILNSALFALILLIANLIFPDIFRSPQIFLINIFGVAFILSYFWINFLLWFFTVGIVTDKRIIDLDFYNIIYKEFSATTIRQVSDITTKVGGFFGSILNFGNVFVKTEGFEQNVEFDDVPRPGDVVKIINQLMETIEPIVSDN